MTMNPYDEMARAFATHGVRYRIFTPNLTYEGNGIFRWNRFDGKREIGIFEYWQKSAGATLYIATHGKDADVVMMSHLQPNTRVGVDWQGAGFQLFELTEIAGDSRYNVILYLKEKEPSDE